MYVVPGRPGQRRRPAAAGPSRGHRRGSRGRALVLETGLRQPEAIELYESSRLRARPGFGYYQESPLSRCFGKRLTSSTSAGAGG